jgi:hypothetical protein
MTAPDFAPDRAQHSFERASAMRPVHASRSAGRAVFFGGPVSIGYNDASNRTLRTSIRPSLRMVPGSRR